MGKLQSFDITLGSDDYVLARKDGVPQIFLGSSPSEPGFKNQIGTIRIDSFEGGAGAEISRPPHNKYYNSGFWNLSEDGVMFPTGKLNTGTTLTGAFDTTFPKYATLVALESSWLAITPNAIYEFDPDVGGGVASVTSKLTPGTGKVFTGGWGRHGEYLYFGAEDKDGISVACGRLRETTGVYDMGSGPVASYFYGFGNKIWWVKNAGSVSDYSPTKSLLKDLPATDTAFSPTVGLSSHAMIDAYQGPNFNTLGVSINSSETTITPTTMTGFETNQFIRIDAETMLITGIGASTFTVIRGVAGSFTASHTAGANINEYGGAFVYASSGDPLVVNTFLKIDNELMRVNLVDTTNNYVAVDREFAKSTHAAGTQAFIPADGIICNGVAPPTGDIIKIDSEIIYVVEAPSSQIYARVSRGASPVSHTATTLIKKIYKEPPEVYWTDSSTGSLTPLRGPYKIRTAKAVNWIHSIGQYLIYFLSDSTFNAVDSDGVFAPLTSDDFTIPSMPSANDPRFGRSDPFLSGLAIVHSTGMIWLQNIENFSFIEFPEYHSSFAAAGISCLDAIGNSVYCVTRNSSEGPELWKLIFNGRSFDPHLLIGNGNLNDFYPVHAVKAIRHYQDGRTRLWFILGTGGSNLILKSLDMSNRHSINNYCGSLSWAFMKTPFYLGDDISAPFASGVTKRFIRVRGYAAWNNIEKFDIGFQVDSGIDSGFNYTTTQPTLEGSGFWTCEFPKTSAALGRGVSLEFLLGTDPDEEMPYINLPIFIDFEYALTEDDVIVLPILVSKDETKLNSRRLKHTVQSVATTMQGLMNTVQTLKIFEGGLTWTVFIEDYKLNTTSDNIIINDGEAVVELRCRRLS